MPSCFSCFGQSSRGSANSSYSAALPADYNELDREQLKELYDRSIALNSGRLIVHGIFARADTKNNNKRVYPKYLLKREVDKYEVERISKGTALGELDHPNYASRYFKCLNLPNISHQVLEVQWKGNQLWGSIEVLPTPSGLLLWELYSQGIKLGVSSRGWASLRTDTARKCVLVDDDFELITFDFVTEPSTKDAYLVPLQRTFQLQHLPNQKKVVQIAHMGHGVCSMELVPQLPPGSLLAARIAELKAQSSGKGAAALHAPGSLRAPDVAVIHRADQQYQQSRLQHLDKLLLYSHYVVDQDAMYLDREKDARNFQAHLTMFASRAHLSNQQHTMSKADLNALIMQEVATKDAAGGLSWSVPRQPVQGTQGFMHLAECQGQQAEEAPAGWPMYPHASAGPASTVVEAARRLQAQQEASTSGSAAGGPRPFVKQSSRSRVHPAPAAKTAAAAGAAGGVPAPQQRAQAPAGGVVGLDAGAGPPPGVMQELQRIKATLAKYSQVQQRIQQQYMQAV